MKHQSKRNKSIKVICLLCAACFLLTGCTGSGVPIQTGALTTLPPANVNYVAPIGDAALEYTETATLYLPRRDNDGLISVSDDILFSASRLQAESLIRGLLSHPGEGVASPMGGDIRLSLYGANPVEVSGDVATVNLAASALQLSRKALYINAQAITNTLTELTNIRYVNVLVMDKHIGLDLASNMPAGGLTRTMSGDIGALYEQAISQRNQAGGESRLNATVTLYFPMAAVHGIMAETRNVSFANQQMPQMVEKLLSELSEGAINVKGSPTLPLISGLLLQPPQVTEPAASGGKIITLRFDGAFDDMLATAGVSRASALASICYTLTTYLPNVTGVIVHIGNQLVEHVMLGATTGIIFDENGIQRRSHYAALLLDEATLYFADAQMNRLVEVHRPVVYYQRTNPRALLLELFRGPTDADDDRQAQSLLPSGVLADADIIGLSLSGQTMLINLSQKFSATIEGIAPQQDRLLAYAIVNTLLCNDRSKRVSFFMGGNVPGTFSGEIDWSGVFYPNMGLVHQ